MLPGLSKGQSSYQADSSINGSIIYLEKQELLNVYANTTTKNKKMPLMNEYDQHSFNIA